MAEVQSPFYAHQELERQLMQALSSDRSSESASSPAHSNSSGATVKWRDTSDLQFRMVPGVGSKPEDRIGDSRWERMSKNNTEGSSRTNSDASSSLQRLKNSIIDAWIRTSTAAIQAVGGYYDDFTFTDFSPKLFAMVREFCNIDAAAYVNSFCNTANENFSGGRSGAFMFSSIDSRFIVKTTTQGELRKLISIMPAYIKHLRQNPHSLIIKFLGAHCITMYATKIYFLVMLNVFPREKLSEKYDLKGSWVNRCGKVDGSKLTRRERMKINSTSRSAPLLFDNDLKQKISLEDDVAKAISNQVAIDSKFLASLNLMDYSLLIGVVTRHFEVVSKAMSVDGQVPESIADSSSVRHDGRDSYAEPSDPFLKDNEGGIDAEVVEAPGTYYFGIIDILQEWNFAKKLERFYKIYLRMNDGDGISAIDPSRYQARFMSRVANDIFEGSDGGFASRQKSRTDNSSICMVTDTPRGSLMDNEADIDY